MAEIKQVVVVGAGTMGSQIALQTALSGRYSVRLVDAERRQLERATEQNEKLVARAVERGRLDSEQGRKALAAVESTSDLGKAVQDADLVIEAVFEDFDVKREVFERADRAAPEHAIIASNSSSIAISRLAAATSRPDRCCNMHFFHPVTVMQLCEVVEGPQTSPQTVETAMAFVLSIDRTPVHVRKEIHGFIVNRILFAALEEAVRLYRGGYAGFEDIDTAVRSGLNWPMGPFQLMDFSGIDVIVGVMADRHRLGEGPDADELLKDKVERGELGRKAKKGFYEYGG